MEINPEVLSILLNAYKPGIVAFINQVDKKVLIVYRKSVIAGIMTFIREFNIGCNRYKSLQDDFINNKISINILETFDNISDRDLKLQHTKYISVYKSYKHYNKRKSLVLKLRKFIDQNTGYIHVQLVNKSNKKFTVGVFTNFEQSEKFVLQNYPDLKNIDRVVYDSGIHSIKIRYKEEYG